MPRFRVQRHLRTTLSAVALACCVALLPSLAADAAGPDTHAVKVSLHAALRAGAGVPVSIDVNLGAPAAATINSDGMVTIPKDAVKFTTDAARRRAGARHRDLARRRVRGERSHRLDRHEQWRDDAAGRLHRLPLRHRPRELSDRTDARRVRDDERRRPRVRPRHRERDCHDRRTSSGSRRSRPGRSAAWAKNPGSTRHSVWASQAPRPSSLTCNSLRRARHRHRRARRRVAAPGTRHLQRRRPRLRRTQGRHRPRLGPRRRRPQRKRAPRPPPARVQRPRRPLAPTTPTTAHVWPTDDTHDLLALPPAQSEPPTTFGRTPIAAEFPVVDDSADGTSLGIGVLVASLGAAIAGFVLLRSEARKLFRRRPHAAF